MDWSTLTNPREGKTFGTLRTLYIQLAIEDGHNRTI